MYTTRKSTCSLPTVHMLSTIPPELGRAVKLQDWPIPTILQVQLPPQSRCFVIGRNMGRTVSGSTVRSPTNTPHSMTQLETFHAFNTTIGSEST